METLMTIAAKQTAAQQAGGGSLLSMLAMFAVIILVFYFLMIRPQKKRQKEEETMRNNIQIGDEITTIGGINGRVVSLKDDSIVLESPADHSKIKIMKWAIQTNHTVHEEDKKTEKKSFFKK